MASKTNSSEKRLWQSSLHDLLFERQLGYGQPSLIWPPPLGSSLSFENHLCSNQRFVERLVLSRRLEEGGHHGCVNCINFSFDGSLLVSGSDDLKLVLWDWERGTSQASLDTDHVANIFQAKFLPGTNDLHLVSAARDGLIIHNILAPSGAVAYKKVVAKHNDSAHKLALQPESSHVFLSCGEDGSVFQIDLREPTPKKHLLVCRGDKGRKIPLYSIFIDPSNYNYFAVSGVDQFARIFDRRTAKGRTEKTDFVKRFCPDHLVSCSDNMQKANITCLVYSHDGRELLCSYNDEDIYLFDATHSSESNYTHHYEGHRNSQTVKGVNFFGPHSEFVVSGSDCGHVFLWDKETEEIVQCQEGDFCGVVNCLEPHPFMPVLAISGLDSDPKIFTPTSETKSINDHVDEITEVNKTRRKEARDEMDFRDLLLLDFFSRNIRRGQIRRLIAEDADMSSEEDEELFFPLPNTRRRHHHEGDGEDEGDSNEDSTDDDSSHDDDDDDDGSSEEGGRRGRNVRVSCRQS